MIYLLQFINTNNCIGYFTIVENKMDIEVVNLAIARFNKEYSMNLKMKEVVKSPGKNIIKFENTDIICVIQREYDEVKVKNSNYNYISLCSISKFFDFKFCVSDGQYEYSLEKVDYDDEFCKCFFRVRGLITRDIKQVVRYGEPFNDGFNTSINNKRIQVRFSDGNIRFRDIDITNL